MSVLAPAVDLTKTLVDASSKKYTTKQLKLLIAYELQLEREKQQHESEEREKARLHDSVERERDRQQELAIVYLQNSYSKPPLSPQPKKGNFLLWFKSEPTIEETPTVYRIE
ncbi:MAG: hypothetical protein FWE98_08015 [Oscillospiraceae bacterium]|nr:hypothetical protein [Oscillospiraceae bacterium]